MLINTAVDFAVEPFDDENTERDENTDRDENTERDESLLTLTEIADAMETTLWRVRKRLITAEY